MKIALFVPDIYKAVDWFEPYRTTEKRPVWKGVEFVVNPEEGEFDGLVLNQSMTPLSAPVKVKCPPTRTLLVLLEPPDILTLPDSFTLQFNAVLSQDERIKSLNPIIGQSGHGWFVEVPIDEALPQPPFEKTKLLSCVTSNKQDTAGHRLRFEFVTKIKSYFGDDLDWFGRGVKDLGSYKLAGLDKYKYHLVLENGSWNGYWTEKLADAFMANCYPFYYGAPDAAKYFPSDSFIQLNLNDYKESINLIERAIDDNVFEKKYDLLKEARSLICDDYHPYETRLKILKALPESKPTDVTIVPHNKFQFSNRQKTHFYLSKIKSFVHKSFR